MGFPLPPKGFPTSCSVKQYQFFLSTKSPSGIEKLLRKSDGLSLFALIKFVLIKNRLLPINKLHLKNLKATCYLHIYHGTPFTQQAGKHSLSILSQTVRC